MIDYVRELVLPADPELAEAIFKEKDRQNTKIELIASENFVSPAVMAAQGSVMTNKYAEGYPGKRYYGGCEFVDIAENLARDRVKKLFGAEHANVRLIPAPMPTPLCIRHFYSRATLCWAWT